MEQWLTKHTDLHPHLWCTTLSFWGIWGHSYTQVQSFEVGLGTQVPLPTMLRKVVGIRFSKLFRCTAFMDFNLKSKGDRHLNTFEDLGLSSLTAQSLSRCYGQMKQKFPSLHFIPLQNQGRQNNTHIIDTKIEAVNKKKILMKKIPLDLWVWQGKKRKKFNCNVTN